jgi:hypothetical protein
LSGLETCRGSNSSHPPQNGKPLRATPDDPVCSLEKLKTTMGRYSKKLGWI